MNAFMISIASQLDKKQLLTTDNIAEMSTDAKQPSPYRPGDQSETRMQDQRELSEILRGIKHDPTLNGVLSMTRDGVLLSLTADREVSSY